MRLGFIGLGAPPLMPKWGDLVDSGKGWWLTVFPVLAATICALGIPVLGDRIAGLARSKQKGRR